MTASLDILLIVSAGLRHLKSMVFFIDFMQLEVEMCSERA